LLKEKIFLMVLLYILIGLFFSFQNFFFSTFYHFYIYLHVYTLFVPPPPPSPPVFLNYKTSLGSIGNGSLLCFYCSPPISKSFILNIVFFGNRLLFIFVVLGFELGAYNLSYSTSPFFVKDFFQIGSLELFAWVGLESRSSLCLAPV
jgi:hypothetical protein